VSGDADEPRCTICVGARLLLSLVLLRRWIIARSSHSIRDCSTFEFTESCLHGLKARAGRLFRRGGQNKKVPRGEARHCSVRGRRSRRDRAHMSSVPGRVIAPAVVTRQDRARYRRSRAAGDDPVSPDGRELARLMPPCYAALAFATWVAIASINGGDRQS
jgi:hypothetical protein